MFTHVAVGKQRKRRRFPRAMAGRAVAEDQRRDVLRESQGLCRERNAGESQGERQSSSNGHRLFRFYPQLAAASPLGNSYAQHTARLIVPRTRNGFTAEGYVGGRALPAVEHHLGLLPPWRPTSFARAEFQANLPFRHFAGKRLPQKLTLFIGKADPVV